MKQKQAIYINLLHIRQHYHVEEKGLLGKRTTLTGLSLRSGREIDSTSSLSGDGEVEYNTSVVVRVDFTTDIEVKYQCSTGRCVPYAFLNLTSSNEKKKMRAHQIRRGSFVTL